MNFIKVSKKKYIQCMIQSDKEMSMNLAPIIYEFIAHTLEKIKVQTPEEFEEAKIIRKTLINEPFKSMREQFNKYWEQIFN